MIYSKNPAFSPLIFSTLLLVIQFLVAGTREGSVKVFLEISQNAQENSCVRVFFSVKLQA